MSEFFNEIISKSRKDYKRYIVSFPNGEKIDVIEPIYNLVVIYETQIKKLQQELSQKNKIIEKAIKYTKSNTDKLKKIRIPKFDFNYNELLEILEKGSDSNE